jgi:hypothetical protein
MAAVPDVGSTLIEELGALGPLFGAVLVLGGIFLMFRGHERLYYVAGATGAGIGYILTPTVAEMVPDMGIKELHLMFIMVLLCGGVLLMVTQYSIYMMASIGIYIMFSWSFRWLDGQGVEIANSDFIVNISAIIAFFTIIWMRKKLPLLVSGLLGSIATLSGLLVLNGQPISDLNPEKGSTLIIVSVLFIISTTFQSRVVKRQKRAEEEEEEGPLRQAPATHQSQEPMRPASVYDLPDLR